MARARYEEKKLDEHRSRAGHTVQLSIVLSDEGDEDEDDTGRLSELIALTEAGLQTEEAEDDTSRLSELIALAETGLQTKEAEDDTSRLSELIALAEAGLQAEEETTRSSLKPQPPQIKRGPLTTGDRQVRATQVSLATTTGLW